MQSTNQKCNLLQSVFGIFLHSCNTPQKVIQSLARLGCSISVNTINRAVKSLSAETYHTLRNMGQTLLVAYTYDNFDIDFKSNLPTVEKSADTLTHLTSGTLTFLDHGVTVNDLKCSSSIWDSSPLNPQLDVPKPDPIIYYPQFLTLHPEIDHSSRLTRRDRFNSWIFYRDLCEHGPESFAEFQPTGDSELPEFVEKIPVVKMRHAPARAMDINQSKVSGNIQAITNLMTQGGLSIGSSTEGNDGVVNASEYILPFFGDLGTGERVETLVERRSIEDTPARRFQSTYFVMGFFHLKMACADALWRIFLENKIARNDVNSLMRFLALHRPKETGKIGSNPGFRRMHEVITQDGAALRLDAWRVELKKMNDEWDSLDKFAATHPTKDEIRAIADAVATKYVSGSDHDVDVRIFDLRHRPDNERDAQRENTLLMHRLFLLYEELTHAMNYGDIGRLETTFPPWIAIFKATGKHKYATHMCRFLYDVHIRLPKPLSHAIRFNSLVNPTGKQGKFRAPDWVQEYHNLKTKVSIIMTSTSWRC